MRFGADCRSLASRGMTPVLVLALSCLACEGLTDLVATDVFEASMNGAKVRPTPATTNATGSFRITATSNSSLLTYELTFTGLSSPVTAAHIHGPARDTTTAESLATLTLVKDVSGTSGSAQGSVDLRQSITSTVSGDSLYGLLRARLLYVDVHSVDKTDGEIRGQISKK
jgi:hypothetical protein